MTATERLRALLDERGVEWEPVDGCAATYVEHNGEAWRFDYDESLDQLGIVCLSGYTPEQAVDATLGPGTCEVEESWHGESEMVEYRCTACDEFMAVEVVKPDGAQRPNYCPNCGRRVVG